MKGGGRRRYYVEGDRFSFEADTFQDVLAWLRENCQMPVQVYVENVEKDDGVSLYTVDEKTWEKA